MPVKYVKKAVKYVKGALHDRYLARGKIRGAIQLTKDVIALKTLMNVEKKVSIASTTTPAVVGQVLVNGSGHAIADLTPNIPQGLLAGDRTGGSVKLISAYYELLFRQMSGTVAPIHGIIEIWHNKATPTSVATNTTQMYLGNKWVSNNNAGVQIIDQTSNLALSYMGNFKLLRRKKFTVLPDVLTGNNNQTFVKIPMKYKNHHIRYEDGSSVPTRGQIFMVIRLDRGNSSLTTPSTLAYIPDVTANTGLYLDYEFKSYFVDN